MAELKQFKLPDVGEGLTEADIVKWHVQPGDTVEINQTIVEIETAKAVVELPCPFEGTVTELHVAEGQTVDVGVPIITVSVGEGAPAVTDAPRRQRPRARHGGQRRTQGRPGGTEAHPRPGRLRGQGSATQRRPRKSAPTGRAGGAQDKQAAVATEVTPDPAPAAAPSTAGSAGRVSVLAKPPVRKLAKDLGVDLTTVTGTGPQGSITREDIQQAAAPAPAHPCQAHRPGGADPDQGGAQAHGGGNGPVRVHRAARNRVAAGGRHRDDDGRPAAPHLPRVRRRQGVAAAARREGAVARRETAPDGELGLGRGRPGDRGQALREPGYRGRHRRAASSCRTSRTRTTCSLPELATRAQGAGARPRGPARPPRRI